MQTSDNIFAIYGCIIKTYYIKIIQKKWKNYLKIKKKYLNSIQIINDLQKREIGKIKFITIPKNNALKL